MSHAQICPLPNIGTVDPRVPRFDPRSADSIRGADRSARRRAASVDALRARLRVRRGERGHADGQIGVRPDVRAVGPLVCGRDGCLQGELGVDGGAATHGLVKNDVVFCEGPHHVSPAMLW